MSAESAIAMWVVTPTYTTGRSETHGRGSPGRRSIAPDRVGGPSASVRRWVPRLPEGRLQGAFDDLARRRLRPGGVDGAGGRRRDPIGQPCLRVDALGGVVR